MEVYIVVWQLTSRSRWCVTCQNHWPVVCTTAGPAWTAVQCSRWWWVLAGTLTTTTLSRPWSVVANVWHTPGLALWNPSSKLCPDWLQYWKGSSAVCRHLCVCAGGGGGVHVCVCVYYIWCPIRTQSAYKDIRLYAHLITHRCTCIHTHTDTHTLSLWIGTRRKKDSSRCVCVRVFKYLHALVCFPHWTFGVLTEDPFHLTSCPESVRTDVWLWILPFFQETHILQEFKEDFYGCLLKVIMLGFIRPMEDYSSLGNWRKLHSFEACWCISTGGSLL